MVLPYKLRTGLNSTRDEKVDKKSDRAGSREQLVLAWSQVRPRLLESSSPGVKSPKKVRTI